MDARKPESPFGTRRRQLPQFSLKSMLMIMMVVAVASSVIVAALKTPDIASDLALLRGSGGTSSSSGRYTHLVFLLLCYCSTMMLALMVQIANRVTSWYAKRSSKARAEEASQDAFAD